MVLISNAVDRSSRRAVEALARAIGNLVLGEDGPAFTLGVMFEVSPNTLAINQVVPGSAADRDGLRAGDRITGIDGEPLGERPLAYLGPYLRSGKTIPFDVKRDGETVRVAVTPLQR